MSYKRSDGVIKPFGLELSAQYIDVESEEARGHNHYQYIWFSIYVQEIH